MSGAVSGPFGRTVGIEGERVAAELQELGGMIAQARFRLRDGQLIEPLATAPWRHEEVPADLPPILRGLAGEWPCVPFGGQSVPDGLPPDWAPPDPRPAWDRDAHGHGANSPWSLDIEAPDRARLRIDYPSDHPVRALERTVACRPGEAALDLSLTIHPRADAVLPVGLHPVLRVPDAPGTARLRLAPGARAWTFPVDVEPGRSVLAPDQRDRAPDDLRDRHGRPIDLRRLPFAEPGEDLVLLTGTGGAVTVEDREAGHAVTVRWEAERLPSCLLWISNGGRTFPPWNGRFRALGIEPIAAPFDLGLRWAEGATLLGAAGVPVATRLRAGEAWATRYAIECEALKIP